MTRTTDGIAPNSGPAIKTYVDAKIAIEQSETNEVGDPHTFTITVMEDAGDGSGFVAAAGETVNVTYVESNGAAAQPADACVTDGSGQCSVMVNSLTAGQIVATATSDVSVGGLTLTRTTDGIAPNSGPAIKTYVDAKIAITPNATNEVGDPHEFIITVMEDAGDGAGFVAAAGETVNVTFLESNGAQAQPADACVTNGLGQCSVMVNSLTAGQIVATATSDVSVGGLTLTRTTDGIAPNSGPATKTYVDAKIAITPNATNEVGDPHEFIITVMEDAGDGAGFVAAAGETVNVTFLESNGAQAQPADACVTDGSGQCSVMVNSLTAGQIVATATSDVSVGGLTLTRTTDGSGNNSGPATKTYVDAKIAIAPNATNEVGDPHEFIITVMEDAGDGSGFVAAAGETVNVTFVESNGAVAQPADACVTDGSGQCSVMVNSLTAGQIVATATSDVSVGGLTLTRTTDGIAPNSGPAIKTYVDAKIVIEPDAINGIGEDHTFIVTVMEDDGSGSGFQPAQGESVTVTLIDAGGAAAVVSNDTCGSTDANGQCEVTFTSDTAGTVTGHAESNVQVGGLSLFRETDGVAPNSDDAVKTFIDGSLTWIKHNSQGNLLGGATFEVCRTHDRFGDPVVEPCITVLDNAAPDNDPVAGQFELIGLALGAYTIEETVPPVGFEGDPFVETVELTLESPDGSAVHIWINTPGQGCTPGWWKNQGVTAYDQPSDLLAMVVEEAVETYWGGDIPGFEGTTTSLFRDAFNLTPADMSNRGLDPNLTLLGAIALGGGNYNALARHGASALLNSLSIAYEFDADQILQDVHDSFVSGAPTPSSLISAYSTANNRDHSACPTGL